MDAISDFGSIVTFVSEKVGLPIMTTHYTFVCGMMFIALSLLVPQVLDLSPNKAMEANPKALVNRIVASIHAALMFFLAISYWIRSYPAILQSPAGTVADPQQIFAVEIMLGYLLYDCLIDTMWPKDDGTWDLSMVVHHIMGAISLGAVRYYHSVPGYFYNTIVFLAEASTPALHSSWIMYSLKKTGTLEYQLIGWSLVGLFFIFRVLLAPWLVHKMWTERSVWDNEPAYMFEGNFAISVVFTVMQLKWFFDLIKMAMKTKGMAKDKKHPE